MGPVIIIGVVGLVLLAGLIICWIFQSNGSARRFSSGNGNDVDFEPQNRYDSNRNHSTTSYSPNPTNPRPAWRPSSTNNYPDNPDSQHVETEPLQKQPPSHNQPRKKRRKKFRLKIDWFLNPVNNDNHIIEENNKRIQQSLDYLNYYIDKKSKLQDVLFEKIPILMFRLSFRF